MMPALNEHAGLIEQALGPRWQQLPVALRAHHPGGRCVETGWLDIEIAPGWRPLWWLLRRLGALVDRAERQVATQVERRLHGGRQHWHRSLRFADGSLQRFDSRWELDDQGRVLEFVNPWLGLALRPEVVGERLQFHGQHYLLRLGRWRLRLPLWLGPGAASIDEQAVDERHVAIDFRLVHPLFGPMFRYSGVFEVDAQADRGDGHQR